MDQLVSKGARVYLAGHTGLVGGAIYRALQAEGFTDILVCDVTELDLTDQAATRRFFDEERPEAVIDAAAKVGGILANWELPWEFVEQNLLIELNLIGEAFRHDVKRLVFLGSSCIYPREAPQPLKEESLLTGPLEETNRAYAMAKISGIEMCRSLNREYGTDYLSLMPTNLYGPGDNFDLTSSHVLPAMIRKFHEAKVAQEAGAAAPDAALALWGTGRPRREFLYVEDVARAITFALMNVHAADVPDGLLNVGCGEDVTIRELAATVQRVVGYEGPVLWDDSRPDGTPRKLMDVTRIKSLGWAPEVGLEDGIRRTYHWYLENRT
jgi:GDP-L-fucose synthase